MKTKIRFIIHNIRSICIFFFAWSKISNTQQIRFKDHKKNSAFFKGQLEIINNFHYHIIDLNIHTVHINHLLFMRINTH